MNFFIVYLPQSDSFFLLYALRNPGFRREKIVNTIFKRNGIVRGNSLKTVQQKVTDMEI